MADSPFPSYYFHRFEVRSKRPSAWEEVPCALGLEHHHVALPFLHMGGCRIGSDFPLGGRLSAAAAVSWETVGSACIALRDPQTSQWSYVSFEKAKQAVWLLRHLGMLSLNPYIKCRNLQFRTYLKVNAWHFWLLRTKFTFFFFVGPSTWPFTQQQELKSHTSLRTRANIVRYFLPLVPLLSVGH